MDEEMALKNYNEATLAETILRSKTRGFNEVPRHIILFHMFYVIHCMFSVPSFRNYCSVKNVSPQRAFGLFFARNHIGFKLILVGLAGRIAMHPITVVRFMLVAKHAIANDVTALPKTMSLVKCVHACYRDRTCGSFFYEPTLQKCYQSSRNIQKEKEHRAGPFSYYRKEISKEKECHQKGLRFAQIGHLCYRQSTIKQYWEDAQLDCEKLGGTLFNIDSPAKHDFFVRVVRRETSGRPHFIGASRANASAEWTWTDGRNIKQTHWLPGEPDYTMLPQNCVQYGERDMKYLWDSTLCQISKHYYCHYP